MTGRDAWIVLKCETLRIPVRVIGVIGTEGSLGDRCPTRLGRGLRPGGEVRRSQSANAIVKEGNEGQRGAGRSVALRALREPSQRRR